MQHNYMKSNDATGEQIKKNKQLSSDRDKRIQAHKSMAIEATDNTLICGGYLPCFRRPVETLDPLDISLMMQPDSVISQSQQGRRHAKSTNLGKKKFLVVPNLNMD